jgi:chromosome partitioning protein
VPPTPESSSTDGPTGRPTPQFGVPSILVDHGPARVVAVCNQKGGVGKTTTTINLGAALAEHGRRVLLVDLDPQGSLSVGMGMDAHNLERSIYDVLLGGTHVTEVLERTEVENMDLVPSNIVLSAAELQLVNEVAREQTLARSIAPVLSDYDVVLIDCQPALGLLTVNALTAAHGVLVPLECEYFALRGVALLQDTIAKVQERLNDRLVLEGLLATRYDAQTIHRREVLHRLVEVFGDTVYHTVIPRTVRFPEATTGGVPIIDYAPRSPGARAYRQLALEVLSRWDAQ